MQKLRTVIKVKVFLKIQKRLGSRFIFKLKANVQTRSARFEVLYSQSIIVDFVSQYYRKYNSLIGL